MTYQSRRSTSNGSDLLLHRRGGGAKFPLRKGPCGPADASVDPRMSVLPTSPRAAPAAPYKDLCHMVPMGTLPPLRQVVVPQPLGCEFDVGVISGATRVKVVVPDLRMIPVALSSCHYGPFPRISSGVADDSATQSGVISGIFISFLQYLFSHIVVQRTSFTPPSSA